jgi:hypothetical protein
MLKISIFLPNRASKYSPSVVSENGGQSAYVKKSNIAEITKAPVPFFFIIQSIKDIIIYTLFLFDYILYLPHVKVKCPLNFPRIS